MKRIAKTYKLSKDTINHVHEFCDDNGMEYSFFVSKAVEEKLIKEMDWQKQRKKYEKV